MAGYEDLLAKGFELPFSYRLGQYLLGMGDVFGDVNKSLLQSGKLGQESLEGLERTRIAEDTLAERRREADLKMEERGWARDDRRSKADLERLRRQAGEALYNVPRTMTDEVVTEGQAPSLEEQETQPRSFFQQLSKVDRSTTMPEAIGRIPPELRGYLTPENLAVAGKFFAEPKKADDYTIGRQRISGATNKPVFTGEAEPKEPTEQAHYNNLARAYLREYGYPINEENIANIATQYKDQALLQRSREQGLSAAAAPLTQADATPSPGLPYPRLSGGPAAPAAPAPPPGAPSFLRNLNPDQRDPGVIGVSGSVADAARRDLPNARTLVPPAAPAAPAATQPVVPPPTAGAPPQTILQRKAQQEADIDAKKQMRVIDYRDEVERKQKADLMAGDYAGVGEIITQIKDLIPKVNSSRLAGLTTNQIELFMQSNPDVIKMHALGQSFTSIIAKVVGRNSGILSNQDIADARASVPSIRDSDVGAIAKLEILESIYNKAIANTERIRGGSPPLTDAPAAQFKGGGGGGGGAGPPGAPQFVPRR